MVLAVSEERDALRSLVRRFVEDRSPMAEVRVQMATEDGYDAAVWGQLSGELGLTGLHVPEAEGGAGYGFAELTVALEETGRGLLCSPLFSATCLGIGAVLHAGTAAQRAALLPDLAEGTRTATLAHVEVPDRLAPGDVSATASGGRVSGRKVHVVDGATADLLVVSARDAGTGELGLYAVERAAPGVTTSAVPTLDLTRRLATVVLSDAPAELLAGSGRPALERTLHGAAVGLAAEQVGGAQACLDMATGYAKVREQFGRPIGSFQAVKHLLVDTLVAVESARSALAYAVAVLDGAGDEGGDGDVALAASLVRAHASEVFSRAATVNVQVHGGIGFTWEHDAHLLLKRAKSSEVLLGSPQHHREQVAHLMLDEDEGAA